MRSRVRCIAAIAGGGEGDRPRDLARGLTRTRRSLQVARLVPGKPRSAGRQLGRCHDVGPSRSVDRALRIESSVTRGIQRTTPKLRISNQFPTRCGDPFTPARHIMWDGIYLTIVAQTASAPPGRIAAIRYAGPRWRRRRSTTLTGETQWEARQVRALNRKALNR
jgi:hypothetical protein